MKELVLKIRDERYKLFLQFLRTLDYVTVTSPAEEEPAPIPKYDFSDLIGKLEWKGDAVYQQRMLRDEW